MAHQIYYKGESENPIKRLWTHNANESLYTKGKGPWELVYVEEFKNRLAALKRERKLKRLNNRSLQIVLKSASNVVQKFR